MQDRNRVIDDRPRFYQIQNDVLKEYGAEMGPNGIAVYNALCLFANSDGDCHPSIKTIGDTVGIKSKTTTRAYLAILEKLKLIRITPRVDEQGDATSNNYHLNFMVKKSYREAEGSAKAERGRSLNDPGVVQQMTQGSTANDPGVVQQMTPNYTHIEQYPLNNTQVEEERSGTAAKAQPTPPDTSYWGDIDFMPDTKPKTPPAPQPVKAHPQPEPAAPSKKPYTYVSPYFDKSRFDADSGYIHFKAGQTAVEVYYERFKVQDPDHHLTDIQEKDLVELCPDLNRLREVVVAYSRTRFGRGNLQLILDWYQKGIPQKYQSLTQPAIYKAQASTYQYHAPAPVPVEDDDNDPEMLELKRLFAEHRSKTNVTANHSQS